MSYGQDAKQEHCKGNWELSWPGIWRTGKPLGQKSTSINLTGGTVSQKRPKIFFSLSRSQVMTWVVHPFVWLVIPHQFYCNCPPCCQSHYAKLFPLSGPNLLYESDWSPVGLGSCETTLGNSRVRLLAYIESGCFTVCVQPMALTRCLVGLHKTRDHQLWPGVVRVCLGLNRDFFHINK